MAQAPKARKAAPRRAASPSNRRPTSRPASAPTSTESGPQDQRWVPPTMPQQRQIEQYGVWNPDRLGATPTPPRVQNYQVPGEYASTGGFPPGHPMALPAQRPQMPTPRPQVRPEEERLHTMMGAQQKQLGGSVGGGMTAAGGGMGQTEGPESLRGREQARAQGATTQLNEQMGAMQNKMGGGQDNPFAARTGAPSLGGGMQSSNPFAGEMPPAFPGTLPKPKAKPSSKKPKPKASASKAKASAKKAPPKKK